MEEIIMMAVGGSW